MTPEAWQTLQAIGTALLAAVSGVLVAVVSRTNAKVASATTAAQEARDNTQDVAAGFAAEVTAALAEIKAGQETQRHTMVFVRDALVRHLDEHVRADGGAPNTIPIGIKVITSRQDWDSSDQHGA